MGPNRNQWDSMVPNGNQWASMELNGDKGHLGVPWGSHGGVPPPPKLTTMVANCTKAKLCDSMGLNGNQWGSMGLNGNQWKPMGLNGNQ